MKTNQKKANMRVDFLGGLLPSFGHLDRNQTCFLNFAFDAGKNVL